jgi:hypothetical protein
MQARQRRTHIRVSGRMAQDDHPGNGSPDLDL